MKRVLTIGAIVLLTAVNVAAQGRGRAPRPAGPATHPGRVHSNAPARTPPGSPNRDFGRDRALEVGRGKEKGLHKMDADRQLGRDRAEEAGRGKKKGLEKSTARNKSVE